MLRLGFKVRVCPFVVVAASVFASLSGGCAAPATTVPSIATLYEHRPASWFEELTHGARVSPDGRWALFGTAPRLRLVDLTTGNEDPERLNGPFESIENAVFGPEGRLVRLVMLNDERRWLDEGTGAPLAIPADALPTWSTDGRHLAFFRSTAPAGGVTIDGRSLPVPRHLLRVMWTPDAATLVAVTRSLDYTVTLGTVNLVTGAFRVVSEGLDAEVFPAQTTITPDGREAIVALASDRSPDPGARHDPNADRDLDLWAVDLENGSKRLLVAQPGDDFAPQVANGELIWTSANVAPSVAVVPLTGGPLRTVADRGELPDWSHDGRQLAFTIGGWRLRDVALPLDAYVVDIDEAAIARSAPRPLITGFHEDFTPAWSPDGRWLAFHSHRSPTSVPSYFSEGSTDDLWLALASDPKRTERRLTDFGRDAGSAVWSPDGDRLAFVSHDHDRTATPQIWIVTIEPETGIRRAATRLPLPQDVTGPSSVAWSPDGATLAIASSAGSGRQALSIVSLADDSARRVAEYPATTFGGVDWTPDGKTLIYSALADASLQLFAIDVIGGPARQLTRHNANVLHPKVSPDGRWVAATSMAHMRRVQRIPLAVLRERAITMR